MASAKTTDIITVIISPALVSYFFVSTIPSPFVFAAFFFFSSSSSS